MMCDVFQDMALDPLLQLHQEQLPRLRTQHLPIPRLHILLMLTHQHLIHQILPVLLHTHRLPRQHHHILTSEPAGKSSQYVCKVRIFLRLISYLII